MMLHIWKGGLIPGTFMIMIIFYLTITKKNKKKQKKLLCNTENSYGNERIGKIAHDVATFKVLESFYFLHKHLSSVNAT